MVRMTQQELHELVHYDPETGVFTGRVERRQAKVGGAIGTVTSGGYVRMTIKQKVYLAHQLVWLYVYGEWPTKKLDHKNNVRNDNRLCNLREADDSQNLFNRGKQSNNTSGHKGVTWDKRTQSWMTRVHARGKQMFFGRFKDKEVASAKYREAAALYHGEFAKHRDDRLT